ncbi:ECF subfamily RNA polymerase sigma-24 factor [Paenibacillus algicola]|uniref:ECF subfamily RNA polymerase sigma-24 factor n=1 Tax=Paenibacillus algicola TaxID=2565926 RepID=A0A4P8XP82_9BACL|nr:RNA polymerase sigma factor [Paenibacillus algicola]QCT04293.1 ECF subfamily RNA polymerase sigma-24 factor [Paenibacillus algicola]
MISDQKLTERMAEGDQEAFELLVSRYHGPLLSYASGQLGDREKAQDMVQETFVRLIRHLRRHGALEHVKAWLYRVVLNLCRDYWKSAAYRSEKLPAEELPDAADETAGAQELLERQETSREIAASLAALPEIQQNVISLRFFHDMKLQEISGLTGLPLSTVKTHLYSGLRKLKSLMASPRSSASVPEQDAQAPPASPSCADARKEHSRTKPESEVYSYGSHYRS